MRDQKIPYLIIRSLSLIEKNQYIKGYMQINQKLAFCSMSRGVASRLSPGLRLLILQPHNVTDTTQPTCHMWVKRTWKCTRLTFESTRLLHWKKAIGCVSCRFQCEWCGPVCSDGLGHTLTTKLGAAVWNLIHRDKVVFLKTMYKLGLSDICIIYTFDRCLTWSMLSSNTLSYILVKISRIF